MNKLIIMTALLLIGTEMVYAGSIITTPNPSTSLSSDRNMTMSSNTNFNITYNKTSYILKPYSVINGITTNLDSASALSLSQLTYEPIIIKNGDDYKFAFNFTQVSRLTEIGWGYSNLQHNNFALWNKEKTILINFGDLIQAGYNITIDDKYVRVTNLKSGKNNLDPLVSFIKNSGTFTQIGTGCVSFDLNVSGSNTGVFTFVNYVNDFNNVDSSSCQNSTYGTYTQSRITNSITIAGGGLLEGFYNSSLGTQTNNAKTLTTCFTDAIEGGSDIIYGVIDAVTLNGVNQTNAIAQFKTNVSTSAFAKAYLNITGTNSSNIILDNIIVASGATPNVAITRDLKQYEIINRTTFGIFEQMNLISLAGSWKNASNLSTMTNYTLSTSKRFGILGVEVNGKIAPPLPAQPLNTSSFNVYTNMPIAIPLNQSRIWNFVMLNTSTIYNYGISCTLDIYNESNGHQIFTNTSSVFSKTGIQVTAPASVHQIKGQYTYRGSCNASTGAGMIENSYFVTKGGQIPAGSILTWFIYGLFALVIIGIFYTFFMDILHLAILKVTYVDVLLSWCSLILLFLVIYLSQQYLLSTFVEDLSIFIFNITRWSNGVFPAIALMISMIANSFKETGVTNG